MFWWSVFTSTGREFWVKGGAMFSGLARNTAEDMLDPGEIITSWQRKDAIETPRRYL